MPYVGALADVPAGWFLCDGTNGTPDLRNKFLESFGDYLVGTNITAGLPDIKGYTEPTDYGVGGAFYANGNVTNNISAGMVHSGAGYWTGFAASKYNPIYGASSTVQPAAYTVYYIIRRK